MNEMADIDLTHAAYDFLTFITSVLCCKSVALAYHSFVFFHPF